MNHFSKKKNAFGLKKSNIKLGIIVLKDWKHDTVVICSEHRVFRLSDQILACFYQGVVINLLNVDLTALANYLVH